MSERTPLVTEIAVLLACIAAGAVGLRLGYDIGLREGLQQGIKAVLSAPPMHTTCCALNSCWLARQDGQCYLVDKPDPTP